MDIQNNSEINFWAGGFGSGDNWNQRLRDFIENNYWAAFDYTTDDNGDVASRNRRRFNRIKVNDYFLIKGFGGRSDLKVHYVGRVKSIELENYRINLEKIDIELYKGKAPSGQGAGNWFDTIVHITNRTAIKKLFNIEVAGANEDDIDGDPKMKNKETGLNQILYGPPGTGKTYHTINKALEIIDPIYYNKNRDNRESLTDEFRGYKNKGQIAFITFHQSMSYEDFIEGIKPIEPKAEGQSVIYKVVNGIFKNICYEAGKNEQKIITIDGQLRELTPELFSEFYNEFAEGLIEADKSESNCILTTNEGYKFELYRNSVGSICVMAGQKKTKMSASVVELTNVLFNGKLPTYKSYEQKIIDKILEDKNFEEIATDNTKMSFVLIIDEINRGNIANIFGELITLIEPDKRFGADEALSVTLPYSKEEFSVPSNLYIIGTMNTADRSVEALDTALRRRFSFEEIPPKPELIKDNNEQPLFINEIDVQEMLSSINKRIEKLLDKDHCIGHSYFMGLKDKENPFGALKALFKNKIIPLLNEYFYNDPVKISLVIGKDFFIDNGAETIDAKDFFAETFEKNLYDYQDYAKRRVYKLRESLEWDEQTFINIYNRLKMN